MKGLILTTALGLVCVSALAQGTINFANSGPGLQAKVFDTDGVTPLSGYAWGADLYWAPGIVTDSTLLTALDEPTNFSTAPVEAGFFFGGVRTIPLGPSGSMITAQVRVWDFSSGPSWYAASMQAGARVGASILFQVTLGTTGSPALLTGLNGNPWNVDWVRWVVQGPFNYTTTNGTITITAYNGPGGAVVIPGSIDGLPVTGIEGLAPAEVVTTNLTSVTIPSSVTNIAAEALYCVTAINVSSLNPVYSSLAGVLFNKSQTTLLEWPGLRSGDYAVPTGVTNIAAFAFTSGRLTSVTIPSSVTSIGANAFADASISSVTIPPTVTDVGWGAFAFCSSLTNATIDNGVASIGGAEFYDTGLRNITIPSSLTNLADEAFQSCANLTRVDFEGNAPSLGASVFDGDAGATVYYLPGTTGWGTTFGGRPTALWVLPNPVILSIGPSFGVQSSQFGFRISWATNASVVVEASSNGNSIAWLPVSTNALAQGWSYFSDPEWANYRSRLYRLRWP